MTDENTGLQAEPAKSESNSALWDIGWKYLDLHKHTHDLARALQSESDAFDVFKKASNSVTHSREMIAELQAELAELEATK